MNIADKADRLFAARGIKSQAEFAKSIGIGEVTLYNTFRKGSEPRINTALAIARGLGVSVEWLFDDAADWPPPDALEVGRPPLPIAPWPPHGITWPEVQRAISEYVMRRVNNAATGAPKPPKPPRPMSPTMEAALQQVEDSMAMRAAADELSDLMQRLRVMTDAMQPAEAPEQSTSSHNRSKKAARKA